MTPSFSTPLRILLASALFCVLPASAWAAGEAGQSTILTVMTFTPMLGALLVLLVPRGREGLCKYLALLASLASLACAIQVVMAFDRNLVAAANTLRAAAPSLDYAAYGLQFVHHVPWITGFNIEYFVGVDGVSIAMILLCAVVSVVAVLASFWVKKPVTPAKGYMSGIQFGERGEQIFQLVAQWGVPHIVE